jgi:sterol desaturase/sphingolipid hydroxylase (fatty acid hydroxylase superfamily)
VFSFWDRLFGTFRFETSGPVSEFRFGLDDVGREQAGSFSEQLKLPWHRRPETTLSP